jgi:hypothetical protein
MSRKQKKTTHSGAFYAPMERYIVPARQEHMVATVRRPVPHLMMRFRIQMPSPFIDFKKGPEANESAHYAQMAGQHRAQSFAGIIR